MKYDGKEQSWNKDKKQFENKKDGKSWKSGKPLKDRIAKNQGLVLK